MHRWFKTPQTVIFIPLVLLLVLIVACGEAATPAPAAPIDQQALSDLVRDAVQGAVPDVPAPVSQEELQQLIQTALSSAAPSGGLTSADVKSVVEAAMAAATPGATKAEVEALVATAVADAVTDALAALPTPVPTPTAAPRGPQMGKDRAVAVIAEEPTDLKGLGAVGGHPDPLLHSIYQWIGHLDRDTLKVAPTSSVVSWKQTAPAEWEYKLRPGVTFHNGDEWNAEAWRLHALVGGNEGFAIASTSYTGPYSVDVIDEFTVGIKCEDNCPLFSRALNLVMTMAPGSLKDVKTPEDLQSISVAPGAGPFEVASWDRGTRVILKRFEDYVPAPETPEYAAPILSEVEWQWREETTVRTAMILAGEADVSFLLTLDDARSLGPDRWNSGGTAEIASFRIDTIWDPWMKQKKFRQAVVHSIDCPGIVDSLYEGSTTCRGNFGAPGVLGNTPENLKVYEYDPALSRSLLEEIGYICGLPNSADNCEAELKVTSRGARIAMNVEMIESMASFMVEAGINAKPNILESAVRGAMGRCGLATEGAGGTQVGWLGATEAVAPTCIGGVGSGQMVDFIGMGYELMDYGTIIRQLNCESGRSTVCVPEKQEEFMAARTLAGEERRAAMEAIADYVHEEVLWLPMFDLYAINGINAKLRGFEEPRYDRHLFSNLWWFAP